MKLLMLLGGLFLGTLVLAQESTSTRQKHFNTYKNHLAIQGYDPVAYFEKGKAVKGTGTYRFEYKGIIYHFSSEEHKSLFEKNPSKYEPQYGGWCAYAMGDDGDKVEINPSTFKIVDGKLYLFYNKSGENTKVYWNEDEDELMKEGNKNWKSIVGK